jgi:hypothetical protein
MRRSGVGRGGTRDAMNGALAWGLVAGSSLVIGAVNSQYGWVSSAHQNPIAQPVWPDTAGLDATTRIRLEWSGSSWSMVPLISGCLLLFRLARLAACWRRSRGGVAASAGRAGYKRPRAARVSAGMTASPMSGMPMVRSTYVEHDNGARPRRAVHSRRRSLSGRGPTRRPRSSGSTLMGGLLPEYRRAA